MGCGGQIKQEKERAKAWQGPYHRWFASGSLVCLLRDGKPVRLATVACREPYQLAKPFPRLGLSFPVAHMLLEAILEMGGRGPKGTMLVQISSSFFSYQPVLRCLQSMHSVPFPHEVVQGQPPKPVDYLSAIDEKAVLAGQQLDPSQREAVHLGLTSRVALIQGPPGKHSKGHARATYCK